MEGADVNPLYVVFLYILRCLVPLAIMLGVSYFLRKLGLIREPPRPPADWNNGNHANGENGGVAHG